MPFVDSPSGQPIFRRIDYIRATRQPVNNGLCAPPGVNPYAGEFGVLSYPEACRLLAKYPSNATPVRGDNRVYGKTTSTVMMVDIIKELGMNKNRLRAFARGDPNAIGRKARRKLSRVLLMLESGQLVKQQNERGRWGFVYLAAPTAAPVTTYRVCLGPDGRATITRGEPLPVPKQMPKMFADFRLPGEK